MQGKRSDWCSAKSSQRIIPIGIHVITRIDGGIAIVIDGKFLSRPGVRINCQNGFHQIDINIRLGDFQLSVVFILVFATLRISLVLNVVIGQVNIVDDIRIGIYCANVILRQVSCYSHTIGNRQAMPEKQIDFS